MNQMCADIKSRFGENTFSFDLMRQQLPRGTYASMLEAIRTHQPIPADTADVIAYAMKQWALAKGATHYTHWFQPLTGLTAEKHQAFLDLDRSGAPIERFTGKELISDEPDASSFPHGGLRSTFEARGYTSWDPSSPAFLMKRKGSTVLCLPSIFVSYTGEVLDKKTPLLRSVTAVSRAGLRMLHLLGQTNVSSVTPYVGAEQEYFLVDRAHFARRPDLCEVGATLIGATPARSQQVDQHYFRAINERALAFMEEAEEELMRIGVPVKTRHNEVAPAQYEVALIHRPANIAADQNQLVMEILRRVAPRHGLEVLLHEKPYARINGSGKHNNWSLIDSEGTNLLEPGTDQTSQLRFLLFLLATVLGIKRHSGLLQSMAASASNDLRLGGQEAPPTIMSVHLGSYLTTLLQDLVEGPGAERDLPGEIDLGLGGIARIPKDNTDRNRTAPVAFTGNKFEFRSVGSSAALSLPNVIINAMVAEALNDLSGRLEERLSSGEELAAAGLAVIQSAIRETVVCRFDGDCYSNEWAAEAQRRGLAAACKTPAALEALIHAESIQLLEGLGILSSQEVHARYRIRLGLYIETVAVELSVLRQMLATLILPATLRHQVRIASAIERTRAALGTDVPGLDRQREHLSAITDLIDRLLERIALLEQDAAQVDTLLEAGACAELYADQIRPHMHQTREIADQLEGLVDGTLWPFPKYNQLLKLD